MSVLTYLLTRWGRVLLEKLTDSQLVKEFAAFYGTHTAFTSTRNPGRRQVFVFSDKAIFYDEELSKPRPNPQAGGPPLVGCPRLRIQYIRSYPSYWRPHLHP